MKTLSKLALGLLFAVTLCTNAVALSITPTSYDPGVSLVMTFSTSSESQILSLIDAAFIDPDPDPVLAYKNNVDDGSEAGPFASSYSTSFFDTPTDPADATITYDGSGSLISHPEKYLLVKDGNQTPTAYLFNISIWNGTDAIKLEDFWPNGGAISHVSILTRGSAQVPDGGSTVMLLGVALLSLIAARRLRRPVAN